MRTIQRIAKNTIVLIVANIISRVFSFLFIIFVARYLGVEDFGTLSFATAFAGIFAILMDFGLNELTVREVARDKSQTDKYLGNFLILKVALSIFAFGIIMLIISFFNYSGQTRIIVYIIAASFIVTSFNGLFYAIFRAHEKMEYQSIGVMLNSASLFLIGLVAISLNLNVTAFAIIYLFSSVLVFIYACVSCGLRFACPLLEVDRSFWWRSFKEAWPIGVTSICIILNFRLDTVMLSIMKNETAVGFYSAAYRITEATTILASMFVTAIFPILSRYHEENRLLFIKMYNKASKYLSVIAFLMAFTLAFLAGPIINLLYGAGYAESVNAFKILIWAAAIMYLSMVVSCVCISANKQMLLMKIGISSVVINFLLNLALIPSYSFNGASTATVISQAYGLIIGSFLLYRYGYKITIIETVLPFVFSGGAALIIALILSLLGLSNYMILLASLPIYILLAYVTGFKKEDKEIVKNVFRVSWGREKKG